MIIRKCKLCGENIEVQSKRATVIKCAKCKEKQGKVEEKRDYDTDYFIYCRICHDVGRVLFQHIITKHNLSQKEYLKRYPDAPLISKHTSELKNSRSAESRALTSKTSKLAWQDPEYRRIHTESSKKTHKGGWKHSEQGKQNIKNGQNKSEKMQKRRDKAKENEQKRQLEERIEKENFKEFVLCPICLKEGKDEIDARRQFISYKHITSHNYNMEQFNKEFLNCKMKIDKLCDNHSECLSGENHFNYGKELSIKTRQLIAEGNKKSAEKRHKKECIQCGELILENNKNNICFNCSYKIYSFTDTYEVVYCRICFLANSNLTLHINNEHNMSTEEYKQKYGAQIYSQSNKDKIGKHLVGIKMSQEHKDALVENALKNAKIKLNWEQNFKKEDYNNLLNREIPSYLIDSDDFIYCRFCLKFTKRITSAHLFTHKLTMKMYKQLFPDTPRICRSLINNVISKGIETKIKEGTLYTGAHGFSGYRKDISHFTRSMIEANFCRILILNKVNYVYEQKTFSLKHKKYSSYTPDIQLLQDFYIWKVGTFLELKMALEQESIDKLKVFYEEYPEVTLIVLEKTCKEVKELEQMYKNKISLWETSDRNIFKTPELYIKDYKVI